MTSDKLNGSGTVKNKLFILSFLMLTGMLVLLTTSTTQAQQVIGTDEFCGLPVVAGSTPQRANAMLTPSGEPYILVDQSMFANMSISMRFTLAHECAHHLAGHVTPQGMLARHFGATSDQELYADCWAAEQLASKGYRDDLARSINNFVNEPLNPWSPYPSGLERAQKILECAQIAVSDTSLASNSDQNSDFDEDPDDAPSCTPRKHLKFTHCPDGRDSPGCEDIVICED